MDVCTLIVATTVYAIGCLPPIECHDGDDGVKYCAPGVAHCDNAPPSYWSCVRLDGSKYTKPAPSLFETFKR